LHQLDRFISQMLRVEVATFCEAQNNFRKLDARGLYGPRLGADAWSNARPSIVEALPAMAFSCSVS
jgi:hypothetical protein